MPAPIPSPPTATTTAIAAGATAAGKILDTAIAAPATPAAGVGAVYVDSTSKNLAVKDDAGVVKHGVQTRTVTASNWLTGIADNGSTTIAQPTFSDISGGSIVSGTAAAGSLLVTAIAAPGTPAAGKGSVYVDSASKNIAIKDDAGVVNHGVRTISFVANQWLTSINADGSGNLQQPSFSNISGTASYAQIQNIGQTNTFLGRKSAGSGVVEEILNSGTTAGRVRQEVLIDFQALSAAAGYTSVTWTASEYQSLRLEFQGSVSGGCSIGLRVNNDTGNNYVAIANSDPASGAGFVGGAISNQENLITGFARIAFANTAAASPASGGFIVEFFPLKRGSSGRRYGNCRGMMYAHTGTAASQRNYHGQFAWNDSATDVTQIRFVSTNAETITGDVFLWGIPA